jgi:hypothetical protein
VSAEPKKDSGQAPIAPNGKPWLTPDEAKAEIEAGRMSVEEATARLMRQMGPTPLGGATNPDSARAESRRRLETSAGIVFDVIQHLVEYRVMSELGRDRIHDSRQSRHIGDLRRRFAVAMINFARELARASRPRRG